jgi:hypothetical protein
MYTSDLSFALSYTAQIVRDLSSVEPLLNLNIGVFVGRLHRELAVLVEKLESGFSDAEEMARVRFLIQEARGFMDDNEIRGS